MSSYSQPRILTFKQAAACAAFKAVKPGADAKHVAVASAGSDKVIGIQQNVTSAAEDPAEIALNGGGAKALCGGTVSFGDKLVSDANGAFIASTTANDRIVAIAMEDGVVNQVIGVEVALSNL